MSQLPSGLDPGSTLFKRRLAAIAFADVAGFSRLMAIDDVQTLQRWKALRSAIIEPLMAHHGGRIAEMAGDAVLIEFPSVVHAVQWATQTQRAQQSRLRADDPFALRLRIGINVDDVIDDDGVLQGDGVNIAARIQQAAEPGQVVVTMLVREYVANRLPLVFRDLGTPPLKNIARPVRVFAVDWRDGDAAPRMSPPYLQWSSRPTVAVLPFRHVGGHGDDAYFGEGITDEIITGLSRSRSMYVIARNSTLRYRDRDHDLAQIAGELDVRYVVDGSVWRQGARLRIKVSLMDMVERRALWSQRFEGDDDEIFAFQDRIAAHVIGSLEPRLTAAEAARASERPTDSLDAYHCVLKAMARLYRFTDESYRDSGELLERAMLLDPGYARAHAYAAWRLNFVLGECRSTDPASDRLRALASAERALELDPDDTFAICVAAHLQAFLERRVEHARELFARALDLDENSAFAWGLSALTCSYLGEPDEALERLQNVWRLSPYDPMNFYFWIVAGIAEFVAGRHGEAIAWARKSSRANPRFAAALRILAAALALDGRQDEARAAAADLLAIDPSFRIASFVEWYPLCRPADLRLLAEGLRAAGLPD